MNTATKESPATDKADKAPKALPELNIVDMLDAEGNKTGRLVEFGMKRKLLKDSFVDSKGVGVQLDFVNGQTRRFYIPESLLEKFAAHGAQQKLGDEIAGIEDVDDCVMAVDDLIDRLYAGDWAAKREASAMAGASILAKALMELQGKSIQEVRAFLSGKNQAQKLALRSNARVAPIIARLEAEKTKTKKAGPVVDTDSLLESLATGPVAAVTSTEPVAG